MKKYKIYEINPERLCPLLGKKCITTDCEFWNREVVEEIDYLFYGSMVLLALTWISAAFIPHRGFIHSIIFGLIASVPLYFFFGLGPALVGFLCFYSHLVADDEPFKLI